MIEKFDWTDTAIFVCAKFGNLSDADCDQIEDSMHANMKGGDVLLAPYGEVLKNGEIQVPPEGFAGFAMLAYFSSQANLAHQLFRHGQFGSMISIEIPIRIKNCFNSLLPGIFSFNSWMGRFPYILLAIQASGKIVPGKAIRVLTYLSYALSRPKKGRAEKEIKKWLASQILFLYFPKIKQAILNYYKRLDSIWGSPEDLLKAFYKDEKKEIVAAWKNKGWHFLQ